MIAPLQFGFSIINLIHKLPSIPSPENFLDEVWVHLCTADINVRATEVLTLCALVKIDISQTHPQTRYHNL